MVTTPETDGQEKRHYETGKKGARPKEKMMEQKNRRRTGQRRRSRRQRRRDGSNFVDIARKMEGRKKAKKRQAVSLRSFGTKPKKIGETAGTRP